MQRRKRPKPKTAKRAPRKRASARPPPADARPWEKVFLREYAEFGCEIWAAAKAGIDRTTAYKAAQRDPEFKRRMADARETARESLWIEAVRRAKDGEPIHYKGEVVPDVRKKSDRLLSKLLDGLFPERFRRGREDGGEGDDDSNVLIQIDVDEPEDDDASDDETDEGDDEADE